MSRRYWRISASFALSWWAVSGNGHAQSAQPEPQSAGAHFERGLQRAQEGDLDGAATEFEAANRMRPHYSVLYNLGQTYAALGRPVDAVRVLRRYLSDAPKDLPVGRRQEVEALLAFHQRRIGKLMLTVQPADADVLVDGRPLASAARAEPIELSAGAHTVVAMKAGFTPSVLTPQVEPQQTHEAHITLAPLSVPGSPVWLTLRCAVPDVSVFVDGTLVGRTPALSGVAVARGTHELRFARDGYEKDQRNLAVAGDDAASCRLRPSPTLPLERASQLRVTTTPAGGVTFVDDTRHAGTVVPSGKHRLTIRHGGYEDWTKVVDLAPGTTAFDVQLTPTPEERSRLQNASSATRRTYAYIAGGAGLALAGTAAVLFAVNEERYDDYQSDNDDLKVRIASGMAPVDAAKRAQELQDRAGSIQRTDDVVVLLSVAGVALLGTGIGLYVSAAPSNGPSQVGQAAIVSRGVW